MDVGFLKGDIMANLNGLYTNSWIRGFLKGKDFDQLDIVFSFEWAYLNRSIGDKHSRPTVHVT